MPSFRELSSGMRLLAVGTAMMGAVALVWGGWNIREIVINPFAAQIPPRDLAALVPQNQEETLAELREKDSDADTLSDYEESYLYNTNPYNEDSDSDGEWDSAEIKSGTDPNCAPDEDCRGIRLVTPDTKISDIFPQFSNSSLTLREKTLTDFKEILIEEGFDPAALAEITDAELLVLLEESLKVQEEVSVSATTTPEDLELDEVRALLVELGVPENEVYSLSNEEVIEILNALQ